MRKTLTILTVFFATSILVHVLVLWAFNWRNDLYIGFMLIVDVAAGFIASGIYFVESDDEKTNQH